MTINNENIVNNENALQKIEQLLAFTESCSKKHEVLSANDTMHTAKHLQYEQLIKNVIETQTSLTASSKCVSESLLVFSNFIKKHESNFDILSRFITVLTSVKGAILWLAAVIGGLGIITGGMVMTWIYISSPLTMVDILEKF